MNHYERASGMRSRWAEAAEDFRRFVCTHGKPVTERCTPCAHGVYGYESRPSQIQRSWDLLNERTHRQLKNLYAELEANDSL